MSRPNCRPSAPVTTLSYLYNRQRGLENHFKLKFNRDRLKYAKNLYTKEIRAHYGCVNAIEFSHNEQLWIVSGGDDRRVLLWDVERVLSSTPPFPPVAEGDDQDKRQRDYEPTVMKGEHHSNIFCLAFDNSNQRVFSGGNDEQVVVHDITTGETVDVFLHNEAVYGLSVDPVNDSVFASACDDGRVLIYDIREPPGEDPFCLAGYVSPMHAVMFNPVEPRLLATANSKEGLGLWDIRKPRTCLLNYGGSHSQQSCMSVRINRTGSQVIGLRRRLPPVLYNLNSAECVYQFDHSGYYNSCTMKSCCFAGDRDQYLLSGSDDFNLYMWRIPEEPSDVHWVGQAHLVLKGHRSIVNQVRYNPDNNLLVSSGVEKILKLWSPFQIPGCRGNLSGNDDDIVTDRPVYTHEEYISLVLHSGSGMTHDYSQQSVDEDPRMMAFFDSLVQRELEGLSSDEVDSDTAVVDDREYHSTVASDTDTDSHSGGDEGSYSPFTIAFASVLAQRALTQEGNETDTDREEESGANNQGIAGNSMGNPRDGDLASGVGDQSQPASTAESGDNPTGGSGSQRLCIASLIAQKRQEYLASLRRSDTRLKSKRLKNNQRSSSDQSRKKLRVSRYEDLTSDSETESDKESHNTGIVMHGESDSDSSGPSAADRLDVEEAMSRIKDKRQGKNSFQRLKILRKRALNSDSENDKESSDQVPSAGQMAPLTVNVSESRYQPPIPHGGNSSSASDTDRHGDSSECDNVSSSDHKSYTGKSMDEGRREAGPHIAGLHPPPGSPDYQQFRKGPNLDHRNNIESPNDFIATNNGNHSVGKHEAGPSFSTSNIKETVKDNGESNSGSEFRRLKKASAGGSKRRYRGRRDEKNDDST